MQTKRVDTGILLRSNKRPSGIVLGTGTVNDGPVADTSGFDVRHEDMNVEHHHKMALSISVHLLEMG